MSKWRVDSCRNPECEFPGGVVEGSEDPNPYEIGFRWKCPVCEHGNYSEIPGPLGDWDDWPTGVGRVFDGLADTT